ncbi:MAG: hypothetical protein ACI9XO_004658 [Paraglaciecola sp.]|jgi:hypothetical protein
MYILNTIDRLGQAHQFNVTVEENQIEGANSWEYLVFKIHKYEHFYINLIEVNPERILILYIGNNEHPSVSGKRIMDFMIPILSERHQTNIVSSSNLEGLKISNWEGREEGATVIWDRLAERFEQVTYLEEEDRYIYKKVD